MQFVRTLGYQNPWNSSAKTTDARCRFKIYKRENIKITMSKKRKKVMKLSKRILLNCLAIFGSANQNRPNVILILADDLGVGDVNIYNSQS